MRLPPPRKNTVDPGRERGSAESTASPSFPRCRSDDQGVGGRDCEEFYERFCIPEPWQCWLVSWLGLWCVQIYCPASRLNQETMDDVTAALHVISGVQSRTSQLNSD